MPKEKRLIDKQRGLRLKEEIQASKMSIADFAGKIHVSEGHLRNVLCGGKNLTDEMAKDAASILGVRPAYLMNYDDFRTEDHPVVQFQNTIKEINNEGTLLLRGLLAFAELTDYTIHYNEPRSTSVQDILQNMKEMWTISDGKEALTLSAAEMNLLENEVYDFVEQKLKNLFAEKGENNGKC